MSKGGVHTPLGELTLSQRKEERGPHFEVKGQAKNPPLFSFNEPFLQLGMRSVLKVRFCEESLSQNSLIGGALLSNGWQERFITFDVFDSKWKERDVSSVSDFRFKECSGKQEPTFQFLFGSAKKYSLGEHSPLPEECIQASIHQTVGSTSIIKCNNGERLKWFLTKNGRTLSPLSSPTEIIDTTILNNSLFAALEDGRIVRYSSRRTISKTIFQLPMEATPVSLAAQRSGLLAGARIGDEHFYYFLSKLKPEEGPTQIQFVGCNVKAGTVLGNIKNLPFTCSDRLGLSALEASLNIENRTLKTAGETESSPTSRIVFVSGEDGAQIPVRLFHPKNTGSLSSKPLFLTQYSAYGTAPSTNFSPLLRALYEEGYSIAIAYLRGGGFKGAEWREAGRAQNKKTTVQDLIAVTKHLRKKLNPSQIVGHGKSAGAWPFIGSLTIEPTLFDSLILEMPVVSPLKQTRKDSPYFSQERWEWGDPEQDEIKGLYEAFNPLTKSIPGQLPSLYFRVATNDNLTPIREILPWIEQFKEKQPQSMIVLEVSRNAGHQGHYDHYDELTSIAKKLYFLELVRDGELLESLS